MKYQAIVVARAGMRAEVFDGLRREFAEKSEVAANKWSQHMDKRQAEHAIHVAHCGVDDSADTKVLACVGGGKESVLWNTSEKDTHA